MWGWEAGLGDGLKGPVFARDILHVGFGGEGRRVMVRPCRPASHPFTQGIYLGLRQWLVGGHRKIAETGDGGIEKALLRGTRDKDCAARAACIHTLAGIEPKGGFLFLRSVAGNAALETNWSDFGFEEVGGLVFGGKRDKRQERKREEYPRVSGC